MFIDINLSVFKVEVIKVRISEIDLEFSDLLIIYVYFIFNILFL